MHNTEILYINIKLHDFQKEFLATEKPNVLLAGGSGIGKTFVSALKVIKYAVENPGCEILVASATWDSTVKIMVPALMEFLNKLPADFYVWRKMLKRIDMHNGSVIHLKNLQDPGSLKGYNIDLVWVDEGTEVEKPEEVFEQLDNRLRSDRPFQKQMIITTNPDLRTHFLYRKFYLEYNEKTDWRLTLPAYAGKHLPQEFIERLERMSSSKRKQLLEGEWGVLEGKAVEFDPDLHISEFDEFDFTYYLAYDYGFMPDPGVWLLIGMHKNNIYVIDELEFYETTAQNQKDRIIEMVNGRQIAGFTGDISAGSSEYRELIENLYHIRFSTPSKRRYFGWRKIIEIFEDKTPRILVDPRCKKFIRSIDSLIWKTNERDLESDYDHFADAFRYFAMCFVDTKKQSKMTFFTKKIKNL